MPREKRYPKNPTEKEIREQKGKTAALVANDGLTPAQGGAQGLMDEQAAMVRPSGKQVLELKGISKSFETASICKRLFFTLFKGDNGRIIHK